MASIPSKRGREINGFNAKVTVAMDARLHESLCRLARRRGRGLAALLREELRALSVAPGTEGRREAYWPPAPRARAILSAAAREGDDGAVS